jgi:hypothetical protein
MIKEKETERNLSISFKLHYSPSSTVQPKCTGKTFNLPTRQRLHKGIGNHVISGAVCDVEGSVFNSLVDEMIVYVNVFSAGVKVVSGG